MKDSVTMIWFTGIISQYNVVKCDIPNLKINHNLLRKIFNTYKSDKYIAIINVRNELEKEQYRELIRKEGLEKQLIFVITDMSTNYVDIISTLHCTYNVKYYIDCSRKRLVSLVGIIEPQSLIHISQLLD